MSTMIYSNILYYRNEIITQSWILRIIKNPSSHLSPGTYPSLFHLESNQHNFSQQQPQFLPSQCNYVKKMVISTITISLNNELTAGNVEF